jgi:NhaP-type Na+/H+ or K+/H+ antiporter
MNGETKLTLIKSIHTLIWIFFNGVIFYMLYAAIAHKLDRWLWIGYGCIALEGLILLTFKSHCPLNLLARKYTNSKLIYATIFAIITIITLYQMSN